MLNQKQLQNKRFLDEIFSAKEDDVRSFASIIMASKKEVSNAEVNIDSDLIESANGKDMTVETSASLKKERSSYIEIEHGWHEGDYVFHIKPWHPKKQYRVTIMRVIYAIAKVVDSYLPKTVKGDIYPPSKQWEIPEITFKALGVQDNWAVRDTDLEKIKIDLFEVLNKLV